LTPVREVRGLEYTLVAVILFSALALYGSDPSGFGPVVVGGVAYLVGMGLLVLSLAFDSRRRSAYLLVALSTAAVLLSVYALTAGNGLPAQGDQLGLSCYTTSTQNGSGLASQTVCTNNRPYFDHWSVLWNVAFWIPVVGSLVYAMPHWIEPGKRNVATSLSRVLKGCVPAGTLLLLTFGLDNSSSGYPELFNGHSPLNPFVAYRYCDSTMFGSVGCVEVDWIRYFADFAFWIALVALLALALSGLSDMLLRAAPSGWTPLSSADIVGGSLGSPARLTVIVVALLVLMTLGLVFAPAWNSGIVAERGTTVQVGQGSFAFIPFSASQSSRLSGSFTVSPGIEAYVMNQTQYRAIDQEMNHYPPDGFEFASGNASSVVLNVSVSTGSYFLVFLDAHPSSSSAGLSVHVTETVRLTAG
jgi:hypothetical protein